MPTTDVVNATTHAAYTAALAEEFGDAYAAVIRRAGQLHKTLTVDTSNFDTLHIPHVEGRYRALAQLDGMSTAAVEILKAAPHNQAHHPAAALSAAHIRAMARTIALDTADTQDERPQ